MPSERPTKITALIVCASLLLGLGGARAEDIDLYTGIGGNAALPNLLFVWDNAADFSASASGCTYVETDPGRPNIHGTPPSLNGMAAGIEQCALYNALDALPAGTVNIGLMIYNANSANYETQWGCTQSADGGCLVWPLTVMDATNKNRLKDFIRSWTSVSNGLNNMKGSTKHTGAVMQEAWAYYAGRTGISGRSYSGMTPAAGCQKNYVIYIGNSFTTSGNPGDGGNADVAQALYNAPNVTTAQKVDITKVPYSKGLVCNTDGKYKQPSHTKTSGWYADEWARYMNQTDLYGNPGSVESIITYAIGLVDPAKCQPEYPAADDQHGGLGRREVLLGPELRGDADRHPQDPERGAGGQQRVRFGQPAGERQRAGVVPEPGVHGDVPSRRDRGAALARQPQAVPVRRDGLGPRDGQAVPRRLQR